MARGADDLDTARILDLIRNELASYQQMYSDLPSLELRNVWINGSFGDEAATEHSDLDVTIEVGVVDSEYDMKPLYVVDRITGMGGQISTALHSVVPVVPDVTVIPSKGVLNAAGLDAPTAAEHVAQTQSHGGYSRVFDVHSGGYTKI